VPYFPTNCTFERTSDTSKLTGFIGETSFLSERERERKREKEREREKKRERERKRERDSNKLQKVLSKNVRSRNDAL